MVWLSAILAFYLRLEWLCIVRSAFSWMSINHFCFCISQTIKTQPQSPSRFWFSRGFEVKSANWNNFFVLLLTQSFMNWSFRMHRRGAAESGIFLRFWISWTPWVLVYDIKITKIYSRICHHLVFPKQFLIQNQSIWLTLSSRRWFARGFEPLVLVYDPRCSWNPSSQKYTRFCRHPPMHPKPWVRERLR